MYCPSCGKAIADGAAFCMHCGKPMGLDVKAVSTPSSASSAPVTNALMCPSCGQMDAVGRVKGIIAQGITFQQSSTMTTGVGTELAGAVGTGGQALGVSRQVWSSASQSQGVAITALAALLADPSLGIDAYNRSLLPPVPANGPSNSLTGSRTEDWARWFAELKFRHSLVSRGFDDRMERLYY